METQSRLGDEDYNMKTQTELEDDHHNTETQLLPGDDLKDIGIETHNNQNRDPSLVLQRETPQKQLINGSECECDHNNNITSVTTVTSNHLFTNTLPGMTCVKSSHESYDIDSYARKSQRFPSKINKSQRKVHSHMSALRSSTPKTSSRRKAEEERLMRVADLWDQVQAEKSQERHRVLTEKVVLQRALIAAQDRRSELIKRHEEEAKVKKYCEEKAKRQVTLTALEDKCRQSLAEDQKFKDKISQQVAGSLLFGNQAESEARKFYHKSLSTSRNGGRRLGHFSVDGSKEKPEDDSFEVVKSNWMDGHHRVTNTRQKKAVHPQLENLSGNLNASEIWTTLWSGSVNKLLQADQRFPQDLKETFGSHIRQGLSKFRKPVFRSFTQTEDVPDLCRLMDQSKLHQIRVFHHKAQLMYRSSQTNQDRTRILLFNNPLPSISNEHDGIIRYLPAVAQDTDSVCSEASYLKWIKPSYNERDIEVKDAEVNAASLHSLLTLESDGSQDLQNILHSVTTMNRPRKEPKYHFLTEQEATTTGAFLSRLHLDDIKSKKHTDLQGQTQMSLPSLKDNDRISLKQPSEADVTWRKEPTYQSSAFKALNFESPWQPLSLNALSEYKDQLMSKGFGDFQQGRPSMWQAVLS